jgi:hypothetical protein
MSESSRGAEFRQAVDVLLREQRAFEDERAQWEYERVELLNKCVQVISQWLCMPAPRFAFEHYPSSLIRMTKRVWIAQFDSTFTEFRALNTKSKRKKRSNSISQSV